MQKFFETKVQTTSRRDKLKKPNPYKYLAAGISGMVGPYIYQNSGAAVALHEVVGHGLLGCRLTHNYAPGEGPEYWVGGFDSFDRMQHAHSARDGFNGFFAWIFQDHANDDGAAGTTSHGNGEPNALGRAMGEDGASAWISITGSIPGLFVSAMCVSFGMSIRKKHPALALSLIVFGLENSLVESTYAWTAASMSNSQLHKNAQNGHDFANFAVRMSSITGLSPSLIAISTALFWTGFVPLIALGIYFYQQSKQIEIVPNEAAVYYFANNPDKTQREQKVLYPLMQSYTDQRDLTEELKQTLLKDEIFYRYLIENLPKKNLNNAKKEILKSWQRLQEPSKLQLTCAYAMGALVILGLITQILYVLATTIKPELLPAVQVLSCIIPILGVLSILGAGYETYKDLKSSNQQVPNFAKAISVLKFLLTASIVALAITAAFSSGMGYILIPSILLGTLLNLSLSFTKTKVLQNSFTESFDPQSITQYKK